MTYVVRRGPCEAWEDAFMTYVVRRGPCEAWEDVLTTHPCKEGPACGRMSLRPTLVRRGHAKEKIYGKR